MGDENGCHLVEESGTFAFLFVFFFRVICCLGLCRRFWGAENCMITFLGLMSML